MVCIGPGMPLTFFDYLSSSKEIRSLLSSVCEFEFSHHWVMQQDNNLKHNRKSNSECLQKNNKCNVLEWHCQSQDFNLIEML